MIEVAERGFGEAIECGLLQYGPDACATGARTLLSMSCELLRPSCPGQGRGGQAADARPRWSQ
jgi:hypothetical protein